MDSTLITFVSPMFAEDIALQLAESEEDRQSLATKVYSNKHQQNRRRNYQKRRIDIKEDDKSLLQTEKIIYLGGVISEIPAVENDIKRQFGLAKGSMQNLNPVWKTKDINQSTKLELNLFLASIATYGAETWTLKKTDEMVYLRKILGVKRRDRIQNTKIRNRLQYHKD